MDEKDILIKFGKKLRQKRREAKLTQEKLAELVDLSTNFVGMVERGNRNTKFANVCKLIHALNCNLDEFFKDFEK